MLSSRARVVRRNAAVCIEEDLESSDAEGFTSRALIYKGGIGTSSASSSSEEWDQKHTGVEYTADPVGAPQTSLDSYIQEGFGRFVHFVIKI